MFLRVDDRLILQALLSSPVRLAERPDRGGVTVTWTVATDVLQVFRGDHKTAEHMIRHFVAPRCVALAQTYWNHADNPLDVDCQLTGWVDQGGSLLERLQGGEAFEAVYRVVSAGYADAFQARFPKKDLAV